MTGWLIVNEFLHSEKFDECSRRFEQEARALNIELLSLTNACLSKDSEKPDFILFWDKDIALAKLLEEEGIPVYNSSRSIALCDSKAETYLGLYKERIPMPKTIIAPMTYENVGYTNLNFLNDIEKELPYPLVMKEAFGSFGQQVYLIQDREKLEEETKRLQGKSFLYQQYIKSSHGKDIRLQVVGDNVVAAMMRTSKTDFRANISNGGMMHPYKPTRAQEELAIRACKAVGVCFAGVDLLFGEEGEMLVCEVNSNAHFVNIERCTGVNVAKDILQYMMVQSQ